MATTSIWRIKGAIGDVIRYAENEKKTTKEILPTAREPTGSLDQLIAYASREEATNQGQCNELYRYGEVLGECV